MVRRMGGSRRKGRSRMIKPASAKGKISLRRFLQELSVGDRVALKAESAYQKGLYFKRFHGRIAQVTRKQGFCYEVSFKDGSKTKRIIVHPVHLKKVSV
jgi:ribosomal protein L21E